MDKITSAAELKNAIRQLEIRRDQEWPLLKVQFSDTCDSLKPFNLIKRSLGDVTNSVGFKDNIINAAVGLTTGYLSKAIVVGHTHNPVKKLLGSLVQIGISYMVAGNPEKVKQLVNGIVKVFDKKIDTRANDDGTC